MNKENPDRIKQLEGAGTKVVQVFSKVMSSLVASIDTWLDSKLNR